MGKRTAIILRSAGAIGATLAIVGGVTYAQMTGNVVTLSDNTISTSNMSNLKISNDNEKFSRHVQGFDFKVTPGSTTGSNDETFYLKNTGSSALDINMFVPTLPVFAVTPSGTVDNGKVFVNVTCNTSSSTTISTGTTGNDLTTLNSTTGTTLTGSLAAGDTATCTANISMASDAISNTAATKVTSTGFDIEFSGEPSV